MENILVKVTKCLKLDTRHPLIDYIHIEIYPSSADFAKKDFLFFLLDFVREVSNGNWGAFSLLGDIFVLVIFADAEIFS